MDWEEIRLCLICSETPEEISAFSLWESCMALTSLG